MTTQSVSDKWCAHPDHKTPMPANGYRLEHFPSAHDVGITLSVKIPMCHKHVDQELPRGVYSEVTMEVIVSRDLRGRRRKL